MNALADVFNLYGLDVGRLAQIDAIPDPRRYYMIAMTPRSGSSYLCDVLTATKRLGVPGEIVNKEFIPEILKRIPGRTPDEYLRNVSRVKKTKNGIYGFKASWFQFQNFKELLNNVTSLRGYRYIYLTRRNMAAQAVSLYKATSTSVFHTNVHHGEDALKRLALLEYDYGEIDKWYQHIVAQEKGWATYFHQNRIFPCCITYEDIDEDIESVVMKIALYMGVNPSKVVIPAKKSVFAKVSDHRNREWACRYLLESGAKV